MKKHAIAIFFVTLSFQQANATELTELTIRRWDGTYEVRQYDASTEKFMFTFAWDIAEITGLENFPNLRELWFERTANMTDFNFLRGLDALETLVFFMVDLADTDFLYDLPSLRELVFQSCIGFDSKIDASRLPNLEYFEFTNSHLTCFPLIVDKRRNIGAINIAVNNISDISSVEGMGILVIADRNPSIIADDDGHVFLYAVPERYRRFIR